jgi:hypothetical protein
LQIKTKNVLVGALIFVAVFSGTLVLGSVFPRSWINALDHAGITGGTAPMSLGAFQAAEQMRVSSIYVMGLMTDAEGKKGRILDPEDPAQAEPRFMSDHTSDAS